MMLNNVLGLLGGRRVKTIDSLSKVMESKRTMRNHTLKKNSYCYYYYFIIKLVVYCGRGNY